MGLPAVLSEELDHQKIPVYASITDFYEKSRKENPNERQEIWLLGASYDTTNKFESEKSLKCGADSCYKKSLDNNKICKPGMLFFKSKLSSFPECLNLPLSSSSKNLFWSDMNRKFISSYDLYYIYSFDKNKKPNVSNSKRKQKILRNRNEVSYSERRFSCNDIIRLL